MLGPKYRDDLEDLDPRLAFDAAFHRSPERSAVEPPFHRATVKELAGVGSELPAFEWGVQL